MNWLLAVIPLIPLIGWLVLAGAGRSASVRGVGAILVGTCAAFVAVVAIVPFVVPFSLGDVHWELVPNWIAIGAEGDPVSVRASLGLRLDSRSWVFLMGMALAALAVSVRGTEGTPAEQRRFARGLLLCLAAAVGVVLSPNFLQLYLLWSLTSLAAWRLAIVRKERVADASAARAVLLMQRLADIALAIGIFSIWSWLGEFDIRQVMLSIGISFQGLGETDRLARSTLAAACILAGVVGRCALFPLFGWLHEAGKAPPAVVAAIVGIVMPTGIHLLASCAPLFEIASQGRSLGVAIGGMTVVLASLAACTQKDFRPAVAFAFVAQLGFAVMGVCLGPGMVEGYRPAILLAGTHAAIYAILLATGEESAASQGGETGLPARIVRRPAKIARWSFFVGALVVGSGAWGEHAVLGELGNAMDRAAESAAAMAVEGETHDGGGVAFGLISAAMWACGIVGLFLTSAALARVGTLAFGSRAIAGSSVPTTSAERRFDGTWLWPIILAVVACSPFWILPRMWAASGRPFAVGIGLPVSLAGLVCGWSLARASRIPDLLAKGLAPLERLGRNRFYLEDVFFLGIVLPLRGLAQLGRFADWFLVDGILVGIPSRLVTRSARVTSAFREGNARFYLLSMVLAAAVLLLVLMWRT